MLLALQFLSEIDLAVFPLCVFFCFFILRARANRNADSKIRKYYYRAFYFKIICVIAATFVNEFYFKGGDTGLYYQATKDMRAAIADDPNNLIVALTSTKVSSTSPLFNYFYFDNYEYDITYNYMISAQNFLPPKVALIPSFLFFNSYISINLCFAFFSLGGAIRLFKAFYYFYPKLYRELALACLFLPGVAFWSSSLLKDPISFGCIGYILYALLNIFFKKQNYWSSFLWLAFCCYLLYYSKVYVLLVLLLSLVIWFFAETNRLVRDKTLRNIFTVLTFMLAIGAGYILLNYVTTLETAQQFQFDRLVENAQRERQGYAYIAERLEGDSHFTINASNPILLIIGGISATFFRPFIWEINSPIALLSAIESGIFLLITIIFIMKRGIKKFFSIPFSDGRILMCFVFAFVFALAVGASTANFGALSRYKIPCMPFYLIMLLLMYNKAKLSYPRWFEKIVNLIVPK